MSLPQKVKDKHVFVDCGALDVIQIDKDEITDKHAVISCNLCDKPAVFLDCLYSYHTELNRCEDHITLSQKRRLK